MPSTYIVIYVENNDKVYKLKVGNHVRTTKHNKTKKMLITE